MTGRRNEESRCEQRLLSGGQGRGRTADLAIFSATEASAMGLRDASVLVSVV